MSDQLDLDLDRLQSHTESYWNWTLEARLYRREAKDYDTGGNRYTYTDEFWGVTATKHDRVINVLSIESGIRKLENAIAFAKSYIDRFYTAYVGDPPHHYTVALVDKFSPDNQAEAETSVVWKEYTTRFGSETEYWTALVKGEEAITIGDAFDSEIEAWEWTG